MGAARRPAPPAAAPRDRRGAACRRRRRVRVARGECGWERASRIGNASDGCGAEHCGRVRARIGSAGGMAERE
eukprot:8181073-Pyramimonas_sp.AAC.1